MISHHRVRSSAAAALLALAACSRASAPVATPPVAPDLPLLTSPMPLPAPRPWLELIGEYDVNRAERIVFEDGGRLWIGDTSGHTTPLAPRAGVDFSIERDVAQRLLGVPATELSFGEANGRATEIVAGGTRFPRRNIEPLPGTNQLHVTPLRPVEALRAEARAATPPHEDGTFHPSELVELVSLDPSIKLEIRYATTNNFLGTRFYDEPRAFMQRPAAEAVVRANKALHPLGYGLLIHDAYRPWYVTKMFWDATPDDKKWLVANPAQGSKHNRGCAVDLTLFDLATGQPVEMPSTYDESTDRAFADYPGGTAQQRWRRALLRRAMVAQGFEINPNEWWHFDYNRWREYAIGNVTFDQIGRR